jgi:hypothetical protein
MPQYKLEKTEELTGFSLNPAREGELVDVALKGYVTSDNPVFHIFIEGIYKSFLKNFIYSQSCDQFLILRKEDGSADVYINDFPIVPLIRIKRPVKSGDPVYKKDVADVGKLTFGDIEIKKKDAIIVCLRVGWKFGFYFNFVANPDKSNGNELDVNEVYKELGQHYRDLLFEQEYNVVRNNNLYLKLLKDGWFPFIELLGDDYVDLSRYYSYGWHIYVDEFISKFDPKRIDRFTQQWWGKPQFKDKKDLIKAGLDAFNQGNVSGYINCINTLLPQIEGIMGYEYFKEHGQKPSFYQLKKYIHDKATIKYPAMYSLAFPNDFYNYLDKQFFHNFDLIKGKVDIGRHSAAHGYAKPEDYTKVKALQIILVLNQLFFYL